MAGLPQTKGGIKLKNLKGCHLEQATGPYLHCPACEGHHNSEPYLQLVTYAGQHYQFGFCHVDRMDNLVESARHHPSGWRLSWMVEEHQKCSSAIVFFLLLSPQSLMVNWPNSRVFCLLYPDFPTKHVHVELCDWLNLLRVTSSSHFSYLRARRSQLKTFILDETIMEVSISSPP